MQSVRLQKLQTMILSRKGNALAAPGVWLFVSRCRCTASRCCWLWLSCIWRRQGCCRWMRLLKEARDVLPLLRRCRRRLVLLRRRWSAAVAAAAARITTGVAATATAAAAAAAAPAAATETAAAKAAEVAAERAAPGHLAQLAAQQVARVDVGARAAAPAGCPLRLARRLAAANMSQTYGSPSSIMLADITDAGKQAHGFRLLHTASDAADRGAHC